MKSSLSRLLVFSLVSLGLASLAFAQSSNVPIEYLRPMKNSVSVGVRVVGGAHVTFSGPSLGEIQNPYGNIHDPYIRGQYLNAGYIQYDDGVVYYRDSTAATSDGKRPDQTNIAADPATGRWQTFTSVTSTTGATLNNVVNGSFLPYDTTNNTTRNWNADSSNQVGHNYDAAGNITSDYIDMSNYASSRATGDVEAKSSASPGIEIQFGRVIQRFKRFEWGFNATFGISEINAKTRQTISANAIRYTDRYQVYQYDATTAGLVPGKLYSGSTIVDINGNPVASGTNGITNVPTSVVYGPSFVDLAYTDADGSPTDANGNTNAFPSGYETTTPLGTGFGTDPSMGPTNPAPGGSDSQSVPGGVIDGYWQVKGVYYVFRFGPMIRVPIGKHFSAALSAGYIAAWVGSKMRFTETLRIPGITTKAFTVYNAAGSPVTDISKYNQKFLSGAYVDANFEWWVSTRTGFYAGLVYEKLSNYKQQAYGRTASIKMDDGLGLHFGIITRF